VVAGDRVLSRGDPLDRHAVAEVGRDEVPRSGRADQVAGQGGLINANIRAGGSVSGVDIPYGTFKSTIRSKTAMPT